MIRCVLLALVALSTAGCATQVTGSNEAGGMLKVGAGLDKRKRGFAAAEAECGKYGKIARVTGYTEWGGVMRYECLAR